MKKIRIPNEILYLMAICELAIAVAMIVASDFGLSPIGTPAYELCCIVPWLTFGQAEYFIQGALFVTFCYITGGFRIVYLSSFVNCLIYGAVLDFWRVVIPILNPTVVAPGSMPLAVRVLLYAGGVLLTGISVASFFQSYMYPQTYDLFVKGVSEHYGIARLKFKLGFDITCLLIGLTASFVFFGKLNGIGIGTVISSCIMGFVIEFFYKVLDDHFEFPPIFPKFAKHFEQRDKPQ